MLDVKNVIDDMDKMFSLIGYKPNNGKAWTGYVDAEGKGRQPITWQTAKMVGINIWSDMCQHYKLFGIVATDEQIRNIRAFAKNNQRTVGYSNMLAYSKKRGEIKTMRILSIPMSTK
ncbi:hypothetical protein PHG31p56 [Aeromonas phage 31]|uniref:Uncharacterized protein n=3 Tax=Biquartavirus 44RR2 TaxID=115987 RepID=Q6U9P5_9CAUD|nr:hypothetical protein ST44RRORF057c [Aeromonas phage 44RR2.8t]YP_238785.1 hypothetical protein PHG31p56 [Aeromonas phage 31]APU00530.1 hypothetical protein [Aeromonas phage 44RR2.8t.2]APU00951.1 hypothetical protein [Aeromonas phage 31.2]APU02112.1 hypothetical protein [Aeromonas phage Riv-10]AAQ81376.1 hypothetical protein 44RRORF057c [Aeromonas phage 44RR2.8t]AAX63545.1 hypothetical protein PHG31p56 [Aeromonas phage 31]